MPRYVEIELDKPRRLRFDINALADAEEALGGSLASLGEQMGIRPLRALIWAGLKWEDPQLSIRQAGDLIQQYLEHGGDPAELGRLVLRALEASGLARTGAGGEGN